MGFRWPWFVALIGIASDTRVRVCSPPRFLGRICSSPVAHAGFQVRMVKWRILNAERH